MIAVSHTPLYYDSIITYVGNWEPTPRWAFWRPAWRRRLLELEWGCHPEGDCVWQYASPQEMVGIILKEDRNKHPPP